MLGGFVTLSLLAIFLYWRMFTVRSSFNLIPHTRCVMGGNMHRTFSSLWTMKVES